MTSSSSFSACLRVLCVSAVLCAGRAALTAAPAPDGNRLAYLDQASPFHVHAGSPRLTTPMWIGETGVDAAVILSIDDMNEGSVDRYREFLTPILERLEELQGYSPLNIFATRVEPSHPQLQTWIESGVRVDVHTRTHPCPLLGKSLDGASAEVFDCLENIARVPNDDPVAFRMPCCDSINSASPLFFAEILCGQTPQGKFLRADTSVLNFPDASYRAYAPFPNYAATIAGYPYPYVVGGLIWEFPIIAPSDWQAHNRRGSNHPDTVVDVKAAMDKVIEARGVYTWCFHPHGWIRADQIVEVIDHVAAKYGSRVRFLNLEEAVEKLTRNALGGWPLRAAGGTDNGVRLLDVNADGYMDVVVAHENRRETRLWDPAARSWRIVEFPLQIVGSAGGDELEDLGVRFGVLDPDGRASALVLRAGERRLVHFDGRRWVDADATALSELRASGKTVETRSGGRDGGVRLRDVDGDGLSDLVVNTDSQNAVFRWDAERIRFVSYPRSLPVTGGIVDAAGRDGGLRFWDIDADGHDDVVLSNDREYCVYLFEEGTGGWTRRVLHGSPSMPGALPKIVSEGRDRGAWLQGRTMYVANESTAQSPDLVEVRHFDFMLEHASTPPLSPQEALETLKVPAGFRVEIAAAEPEVTDPVSIEFGPDGRVWIAEMGTYPYGYGPDADGRVRILRDRDGDGRLETSRVFARGLSFPSGAFPFRKGVLVTCAPDIIYMEDTDGDDEADVRRVVFTGFGEGNQQHRVNGLHFGIDNWIYGANGDSGGTIRCVLDPDREAVALGRRDFRFSLDLKAFEGASGSTQFGLAMDDFGNRFGTSNSRHILHAVLPDRYLRRNPYYAPPHPVLDIPDHGAMARIYPISKPLLSLNSIHVPGHFSSACGISVYRGNRFPEAYRGCAYVAEPVGNIVHRDVLAPAGATFQAKRAAGEEASEFLASTDSWFRPVFTATGPDGALYVVDMYRYVIEHPAYIPPEIQQILDWGAGRDRGRIYRIVYGGEPATTSPPDPPFPDLSDSTTDRLADLLERPGGWWRDMAQRLLLERGDPGVAGRLRALVTEAPLASSRVHALWTLRGLSLLDTSSVAHALNDPSPEVREHALRLAEKHVNDDPALLEQVLARTDDESFRVRLQAAFTLGECKQIAAASGLHRLFERDGRDRWMRAAILSSSLPHAGSLLGELIASESEEPESGRREEFVRQLIEIVVRRGDAPEIARLIERVAGAPAVERWHVALVGALSEGGRLASALAGIEADDRALAVGLSEAIRRIRSHALSIALDRSKAAPERAEAVQALGSELSGMGDVVQELLSPRESVDLQLAALRALASGPEEKAAEALLAAWPRSGPVIRREILQALLARAGGTRILLEALEEGRLAPEKLDAAARERLLETGDAAVAHRAAALFEHRPVESRREVIERYSRGVPMHEGKPDRGKEVFTEHCSTCHRLEGVGFEVGPPLTSWRDKDSAAFLEAVLNPGGIVPPRYSQYLVTLVSGGVVTGLVTSETPASITLTRAGGVTETVLRTDVLDLATTPGSLMPAELEKAISIEDMAHLLSFVRLRPANLDDLDAGDMKIARARVIATAHNGLAAVVEATNEAPQKSWVGRDTMYFARQLDGTHRVVWKTDPALERDREGGRYTFRLPVAMGYISQPRGSFSLHLGDRKLLDFHVTLESDGWRSPDGPEGGVNVTYHVRAHNREDSTGLFVIELPAALVEPGKPTVFRVTGSKTGSRRWFGVLPLR